VRFGGVEVHIVSRLTRRRALGAGLLSIAVIVTVIAATAATATPSRASSRWNHLAVTPMSNSLVAGTDARTDFGMEPLSAGPIWKTFHLVERYSKRFTFVDVAPKGDSPGDYGVFKDPVLTKGGVRIGTIDAQCLAAYSDQCWGSIRIPGRGQITFAGISPLGVDPDHYAITGGTGQFAGVGGVLVISFPNSNSANLFIQLKK
jgi:hypothetical protein